MVVARKNHSTSLLANGSILVAGGNTASSYLAGAEIYDPAGNTWSAAMSLTTARAFHTATLLVDGRILVAGGNGDSNFFASAEIYTPSVDTWSVGASMSAGRVDHIATLLPDGRVLVAGGFNDNVVFSSAEIYDPITNAWKTAASMGTAREYSTATLLIDGRVLVAGGNTGRGDLASAEIYDPISNTWSTAGSMITGRFLHTATLLADGRVLVVGGNNDKSFYLATAVIYNPADNTWSEAANMSTGRYGHTATLLEDGRVLVSGGVNGTANILANAEIYDPAANTWSPAADMTAARVLHTATLLADGRVLAAGGWDGGFDLANAEIYDPVANTWSATGNMAAAREAHTAIVLADGRVLAVGGSDGSIYLASAEIYSPATKVWSAAVRMASSRFLNSATLLSDGRVLVAGGYGSGGYQASTEVYDLGLGFVSGRRPIISTSMLKLEASGFRLHLTGSGFRGDNEASGGSANQSASNIPVVRLQRLDSDQIYILRPNPGLGETFSATSYTASLATAYPPPFGVYRAIVFVNGIPSQAGLVSLHANLAPSFSNGSDLMINEDAGAQTIATWATAISPGAADESGQTLNFIVNNDNNALFSAQPAISDTGTFSFTPALDANGVATVTVTLKDNGGIANGGVASSASQSFTLTVNAVNDAPSFSKGGGVIVNEDAAAYSLPWATNILAGPGNEAAQTLSFIVSNDNNALFSVQPAISDTGTLSFTPALDANGVATVTVTLNDNGGIANGGVASSASQTFTLTVNAVNEAPSFIKGGHVSVNEDAAAYSLPWATNILAGPGNEAAQTLSFIVSNDNNALFSVQPAISDTGTLSLTPALDANGVATVMVTLNDNGGIANGGVASSASQTFTLTVSAVNDAPSFSKGGEVTVNEDAGAYLVAWATNILAGPGNEAAQTLSFTVSNDNNALFSVQPAIGADGALNFTPATDANGSAAVTVTLNDNGGIANGGVASSASQSFLVTVNAVNDPPSFNKGGDVSVNEDSGSYSAAWATFISSGAPDESFQTVSFNVANDNNRLFSVQPSISSSGVLNFTLANGASGAATVTVSLSDSGGGTSSSVTFTILVTPFGPPKKLIFLPLLSR
jgi:N-acetylneuraminic acid mutarotase